MSVILQMPAVANVLKGYRSSRGHLIVPSGAHEGTQYHHVFNRRGQCIGQTLPYEDAQLPYITEMTWYDFTIEDARVVCGGGDVEKVDIETHDFLDHRLIRWSPADEWVMIVAESDSYCPQVDPAGINRSVMRRAEAEWLARTLSDKSKYDLIYIGLYGKLTEERKTKRRIYQKAGERVGERNAYKFDNDWAFPQYVGVEAVRRAANDDPTVDIHNVVAWYQCRFGDDCDWKEEVLKTQAAAMDFVEDEANWRRIEAEAMRIRIEELEQEECGA